MALRIHDRVVRGEIGNRIQGIVRGNARPDPAACLPTLVNGDLLHAYRRRG